MIVCVVTGCPEEHNKQHEQTLTNTGQNNTIKKRGVDCDTTSQN